MLRIKHSMVAVVVSVDSFLNIDFLLQALPGEAERILTDDEEIPMSGSCEVPPLDLILYF